MQRLLLAVQFDFFFFLFILLLWAVCCMAICRLDWFCIVLFGLIEDQQKPFSKQMKCVKEIANKVNKKFVHIFRSHHHRHQQNVWFPLLLYSIFLLFFVEYILFYYTIRCIYLYKVSFVCWIHLNYSLYFAESSVGKIMLVLVIKQK